MLGHSVISVSDYQVMMTFDILFIIIIIIIIIIIMFYCMCYPCVQDVFMGPAIEVTSATVFLDGRYSSTMHC